MILPKLSNDTPLATHWVPLSVSSRLIQTVAESALASEAAIFDWGRQQFREDLSTIYRFFVRVATPSFVAARAAKIWETYVRDAGTMVLTVDEPNASELSVTDFPAPSPAFWTYLRGNIHGAVELTNARNLVVSLKEGGGNQTRALYRVTWV